MYETFQRKLVLIRRSKAMILLFQQEIDRLNKRKVENFIEHLYAFTSIPPRFNECQRLNDEYNEIAKKLEYAINEKKLWIDLYFDGLLIL